MAVSIVDVAKACGVSTATVSRIFNSKDNVRPETRKAVLQVASRLGYSPRVATRKDCVAVLIESPGMLGRGGYSHRLLAELLQAISAKGLRSELVTFDDIALVGEGFFSGAISMLTDCTVLDELNLKEKFPLAVINEYSQSGVNIMSDDLQGTRLALNRLSQAGHHKVCMLYRSGYRQQSGYNASREYRRIAFEKVSAEFGVTAQLQPWNSEQPVDLVAKALKLDCTAIIAASEGLGPQVAYALHLLGVRVPDDFSVVGFEETGVSQYLIPPQSTLQQDFVSLAAAAAEVVTGKVFDENIAVPFTFNERESIGINHK